MWSELLIYDSRINQVNCLRPGSAIQLLNVALPLTSEISALVAPFLETTENTNPDGARPDFPAIELCLPGKAPVGPAVQKPGYRVTFVENKLWLEAETDLNQIRGIIGIVRLIFKSIAVSLGGLNLHAGCLAYGSSGVLILGDRQAGKTTAVLNILASDNLSFVANDQVIILPDDDRFRILGYPSLIKVRHGSIGLHGLPWQLALWNQEDDAAMLTSGRTAVFTPMSLCNGLGVEMVGESQLRTVIVYRKSTNEQALDVRLAPDLRSQAWALAALPLTKAYGSAMVEIVGRLIGTRVSQKISISEWPRDVNIFEVTCGAERLREFGKTIKLIIDS